MAGLRLYEYSALESWYKYENWVDKWVLEDGELMGLHRMHWGLFRLCLGEIGVRECV